MTFRRILISLVASTCLCFNALANLPDNYLSLDSSQKQEILWENINKSHNEQPLPKLKENGFKDIYSILSGLFNLKPSFDFFSDEIPDGRKKIIHANGSTGKISFIPAAGHPFTGIYQTGTQGIARLSLATSPSDTSFTPGMAIKFLLPDNASLNLHVMNALNGQGSDWNFFAKNLFK